MSQPPTSPPARELDLINDPRIADIVRTAGASVTFVELGAWDGYHTRLMCERLGREGKPFTVWAVEPDVRIIPSFLVNTRWVRQNVRILTAAAIGDHDGVGAFWLSNGTHLGSSSIRKPKKHLEAFPGCTFDEMTTAMLTLDTFCYTRGIGTIDLLWMDVQGAERDVIEGGAEALSRTRFIYTEHSDAELYEGEIGLRGILSMLRGWELIEDFGGDALLRNTRL